MFGTFTGLTNKETKAHEVTFNTDRLQQILQHIYIYIYIYIYKREILLGTMEFPVVLKGI